MRLGEAARFGAMVGLAMALALGPSAAAERIKVGIGPVTASGAVFLAQDRGYFAAEGLEVEAVSLDAAQSVAQGVVAGDLAFGATAATAAAYNLAAKGGLKIIGGLGREVPSFHGSAMLASNHAWDGGLKSLTKLGGHSVGIVQIGGPIHYEVELVADKYHVDPKSLRLVPLQGLSNLASALAGGQVDAGIEVNTIALKLEAAGKAHLLAWIGDETPWQNTILIAGTRIDIERPQLVAAFLRAYKNGAHDYNAAFTGPDGKRQDGPGAAEVLALIARHLHQPAAQLQQGISYVDPDQRLDVDDVMHQVAWFKSQNMLPKSADAEAMLDRRFVVPLAAK